MASVVTQALRVMNQRLGLHVGKPVESAASASVRFDALTVSKAGWASKRHERVRARSSTPVWGTKLGQCVGRVSPILLRRACRVTQQLAQT